MKGKKKKHKTIIDKTRQRRRLDGRGWSPALVSPPVPGLPPNVVHDPSQHTALSKFTHSVTSGEQAYFKVPMNYETLEL